MARIGKNILGGELESCSLDPLTGWHRDGCCRTGKGDMGVHTVCVELSADFLAFSKAAGNDLSTPMPAYGFPGLKPGDRWCLCAKRWKEAFDAGHAPKVHMQATHFATLEFVDLEELREFATS